MEDRPGYGAGVRPWRRMISAILTWSGGPPAAALIAEIPWTDRGWRDRAERLDVLAAVVVEPVNGAARNAEGLPRPDVDPFAVDRPGQDALKAVDRLFVVIMAVGRRRETLRGRDLELEQSEAATRVFSRDHEAHRERPEADGFVGRINVDVSRLRGHVEPP